MRLPHGRGPLSDALVVALSRQRADQVPVAETAPEESLRDEDLQLALWICYELHYRGFDEVPDTWEWAPSVISLRLQLEEILLAQLRRDVTVPLDDRPVADRLRALVDGDDGPSLSRYLQTSADRAQFLDYLRARSVYQLKEADPHTWAIPRLSGRAKSALVEIQADEYGAGNPAAMHSELFRNLLTEMGLDGEYGAHVDAAPAIALTLSNVMSMFGLRRDLRGALVGHLAAYEMSSSTPCRRYGKGLRRLGGSESACAFYDAHITADALHEQIAMHDMCGGLAEVEPALTEDIVFGAAVCLHVENLFATHLMTVWGRGGTVMQAADSLPGAA